MIYIYIFNTHHIIYKNTHIIWPSSDSSTRFKSPTSAQNSTLALNMLTGFFLALTVRTRALSAIVQKISWLYHWWYMMIPLKQQFSGSEFFLEKVRANCLTTEQRQVWVLGIPFLGETANRQRAPWFNMYWLLEVSFEFWGLRKQYRSTYGI